MSRTLRQCLVAVVSATTIASTSGCTAWVGYCMAKADQTICGNSDTEWGAGTDIRLNRSELHSRFKQFGLTTWTVPVDTVIASGGAGHLTMKHKQYDFKLQMKYRVEGDARVALAVRAETEEDVTVSNAYLITLADGGDGSTIGSVGGLPKSVTTAGKSWGNQDVEVILSGSRLMVGINGKTITDSVVDRSSDGYIALTFHPGVSGSGQLHLLEIRKRWCHRDNPCLKPS